MVETLTLLKICIAQLNLTVGDIAGNIEKMIEAATQAAVWDADLVVFSELALTGYYPGDLLLDADFLVRIEQGLERLQQASKQWPQLHWVVGTPLVNKGPGKPLHNGLVVLKGGHFLLRYAKQLLPNYDIFNESRHFEPGPDEACILSIGSHQIGLVICEDAWNNHCLAYSHNPLKHLFSANPNLVITINASPSNMGKRSQRHAVFTELARQHKTAIVFVNHIGGHDQIVFDGGSFAVEPQAGIIFEALRFAQDLSQLRFGRGHFYGRSDLFCDQLLPINPAGLSLMAFYHAQLILGLTDYAKRCGFKSALVGCSGGIDSALTLALAVEVFGPGKVLAITMPSQYSSAGSVSDSQRLCANLGISLLQHPIEALVQTHAAQFQESSGQPLVGLALENIQSRIRGTILMAYSNQLGHLLLTTGNKSELSVGYCTLYGDTNGGLGLIGDLYKTEVYSLAAYLNTKAGQALIPQEILDKPPSAELAPYQLDTDSLPPYEVLDEILKHFIEGNLLPNDQYQQAKNFVHHLSQTEKGRHLLTRVRYLIVRSEYKRRQTPFTIRVRPRAFGSGRQYPLAAQYAT